MKTFFEQLAQHCAEQKMKTALVCGNQHVTYGELDARSDEVARYLHRQGIGREQIVAILLERSIEYIVAMIGIWKAGAAFLCISDAYPQERIQFICQDCHVPLVLDRNRMDHIHDVEKDEAAVLPYPALEDAAMAIHTSGSTGTPKGILHDHRSLLCTVERQLSFTKLSQKDIFLGNSPFYFIACVLELITPLYAGCTVHFLPEQQRRNMRVIEEYMAKESVTVAVMTVQLLKHFKRPNQSLRVLLTGSERVSGIKGEGYALLNLYGSSETGGPAFAFPVNEYYDNAPIGRPILGMVAYVLDEKGNRVADGEVGELCLSGVFARGYIGLPEQTAAAFTVNPFAADDGNAVLYHTGDMARWLSDGNLQYVNRKDWQVKINGQRVELGEIELALAAFPHIDTAVVQAFTKANGQQYLCAYYQGTCEVERKALKAFLGKKLLLYMIPEYYIRLDQMPLNLNGKLDRSQLQAPEVQAYNSYRPPVTDLEKTLCVGFADVLNQKQIGLDRGFYLLGGDSLAAMELVSWLQDKGIYMDPDQLVKYSTPEPLAKNILTEDDRNKVPCVAVHPGRNKKLDLHIIETDGDNADFRLLCNHLYAFFDIVVNSGNSEAYDKYNLFDSIHNAFVAYDGKKPVGCACFTKYDEDSVEGKHLFVEPEYRGTIVTEKLMDNMVESIRKLGYGRMICASGEVLKDAMALYRRLGYREIEPYGPFVGMEGAVCLEYIIQRKD